MTRRSEANPITALPKRVASVAAHAGLGNWTRTERATASSDSSSLLFILGIGIPVLAAQVVLPVGYFGWRFAFTDGSPVLGWVMLGISFVLSVIAVIAAIALCSYGMQIYKRGRLMIHLYEAGFVLERTRGRVAASTYGETTADLIVFENSSDNSQRRWDEHAVTLTLPDSSVAIAYQPDDSAFAIGIAESCGARSRRRITVQEFVDLTENTAWGVVNRREVTHVRELSEKL